VPDERGGWLLGVDLGGTKLAIALADPEGRIVARRRRPTAGSGEPQRDLARMADDLEALLAEAGVETADVAAVGVAAPGPLDPDEGILIDPPNLQGWGRVPIADVLQKRLGCPVHLENDANAAALAEWRHGAGRRDARGEPVRDFVYLTMSTGVGGGLILGGALQRGAGGLAGEVGHMPVAWDGEPCACGRRGCLEAYVGGRSWTRRLRRLAPPGGAVVERAGSLDAVKPEHLVEAARAGDPFALAEMARFNAYLARGVVALVFALAPRRIAFGTIVRAAGDALCLEPLRAHLRERLWPAFEQEVELVPAELGDELPYRAGLVTAAFGRRGSPGSSGAGTS